MDYETAKHILQTNSGTKADAQRAGEVLDAARDEAAEEAKAAERVSIYERVQWLRDWRRASFVTLRRNEAEKVWDAARAFREKYDGEFPLEYDDLYEVTLALRGLPAGPSD